MTSDSTSTSASATSASAPASVLASQTEAAKAWAARAAQAGWLTDADQLDIAGLSGATSADLFAAQGEAQGTGQGKPLVVALFGGTGVGKSSVLNRLVGENVAKVGVIRPTSLEATVYVHEAINFRAPEQAGFQRAAHQDDSRRHIVWVDMPDVDSTAAHNRDLVLGFLPFVDVLIYCVSPERYRDEAPWSLLREHADRCAWVFVMNQIDRGTPDQLADLEQAVNAAGFNDPALFATSCAPSTTQPVAGDQFNQLSDFVDSLAADHVRAALHEEGRAARLGLLGQALQALSADWPQPESSPQKKRDTKTLAALWAARSQVLENELRDDLVERLAPVAARMADGEAAAPGELWDDWASDRVKDALVGLQVDAREEGWRGVALNQFTDAQDPDLAARAEGALRESVRASLAKPGNPLQRAVFTACDWLMYALPLAATLWTGWYVVRGFLDGASGAGDFVANGFATNAILLILLAAGLPWLLRKVVEPSPRKAAMLGVRRGLDQVLADVAERASGRLEHCEATLAELIAQREQIVGAAIEHSGAAAQGAGSTANSASHNELTARLRRSG